MVPVMNKAVLSFENVTHLYGSHPALVDVSFEIMPGEVFGLLGPNGAGKTTAISICSGLLNPNKGSVSIHGTDLQSDPGPARKLIGVVPQEIALYEDLNPMENLFFWGKLSGLSSKAASSKAMELLETLELNERTRDRVKTFSGGMKRRLNIGCALMHDPKILLLDEPTVGVDPQAREHMLDWMKAWVTGDRSILYTTHYLDEAERLCDSVAIIDDGKILRSSSLSNLLKQSENANLLVLEGDFSALPHDAEDLLSNRFEIINRSPDNLAVIPKENQTRAEAVSELINVNLHLKNLSFNKVGLHDIFLSLTGKSLRE